MIYNIIIYIGIPLAIIFNLPLVYSLESLYINYAAIIRYIYDTSQQLNINTHTSDYGNYY